MVTTWSNIAFAACPENRHTLRVIIQQLNRLKLPSKVWPVLAFAVMAVARWGASFSPPLYTSKSRKPF